MGLLEKAKARIGSDSAIENQTKEQIQEIVRAYRHSWDIYSESLQNSVDAINRRFRILNDPDFYLYEEYREKFPDLESDENYRGRIKIKIDVANREITIRDNGVGILEESLEEFILPQGSDKNRGQEYGFKGFGLTYIAFISEKFYIGSKHFLPSDSSAFEFSLDNLFDWLISDEESVFPEEPIPDCQMVSDSWDETWNTIIRFTLAEDYMEKFPAISSVDQATNLIETSKYLDGFEFLLRTRTAIGNTRSLFNKAPIVPIDIELEVHFPDGTSESRDIEYKYFHPKEHEEVSIISYNFAEYFESYKRPAFTKSFRSLFHPLTNVQIGTRNPINCNIALCAISSTRLSNIESNLGLDEIESGDVAITYGIQLAIDGMPTGLRIDNWDSKGAYLKRYYVVVDANLNISNQLDPGRKGISQHFARLISEKVIDLIGTTKIEDSDPLGNYASKHLDHGRGGEEGGLPPQNFLNQVNVAREEAEANDGELPGLLHSLSNLMFLPNDEQEVIALFYQLLSRKIIKGYKTVYLAGSRAVYDGAFEYEILLNDSNTYPTDNLGVGRVLVEDLRSRGLDIYIHRDHYAGRSMLPELCIEFKKDIRGLLKEVINSNRTDKNPRDIDLLIVWNIGNLDSIPNQYTLDELENNRRYYHSTTHRLGISTETSTEIQCIVLEEVLRKYQRA